MKTIFISYRRSDSEYAAGALGRELRSHFDRQLVFRDKEDIDGGVSWKQKVLEEIDKDSALLVLIGKNWANVTDSDGKRRLDNPDDPLRLEIADAFKDGAAVIPILLENAEMPRAAELPSDMRLLADINALKLRDGDWQYDFDSVIRTLRNLGFAAQVPPPSEQPVSAQQPTSTPGWARWMLIGSYVISVVALAAFDQGKNKSESAGFAVISIVASILAILSHREYGHRKLRRKAAVGAIVFGVTMTLAYFGQASGTRTNTQSLPNLAYGVWTLRNATDSDGKNFSNSVLQFTSQEETGDGLTLNGTFTWRLDDIVIGSEQITGRYIEKSRQLFLEGKAISPPSEPGRPAVLTTGSYSALLSTDGREIVEGRWGSTADNAPGLPGRWEAFR